MMEPYYNPNTGGPLHSIEKDGVWLGFDTTGCTHKDEMPPEAQEWFVRPARDGYKWDCLNGKWPEEVPVNVSEEDQKKRQYQQWKQDRQQAVDTILVEIDGLVFDGDETSQTRMIRAATLAETSEEKVQWILADNSVVEVTADQLRRAAREAGRVQVSLWIPPESLKS
ncbi:DUF4376 domain-containing protein [Endozoicomonas lisbonensis]|uniref:DUF4376 domain-containing protein n=1 Tax=Endozoicomonas lisbonensis TaxID=3120522 RepID=A0ABV2SI24_9GAMM